MSADVTRAACGNDSARLVAYFINLFVYKMTLFCRQRGQHLPGGHLPKACRASSDPLTDHVNAIKKPLTQVSGFAGTAFPLSGLLALFCGRWRQGVGVGFDLLLLPLHVLDVNDLFCLTCCLYSKFFLLFVFRVTLRVTPWRLSKILAGNLIIQKRPARRSPRVGR
ncbi:hypothetical protein ACE1BS_05995 [Aeromonas jandaei]